MKRAATVLELAVRAIALPAISIAAVQSGLAQTQLVYLVPDTPEVVRPAAGVTVTPAVGKVSIAGSGITGTVEMVLPSQLLAISVSGGQVRFGSNLDLIMRQKWSAGSTTLSIAGAFGNCSTNLDERGCPINFLTGDSQGRSYIDVNIQLVPPGSIGPTITVRFFWLISAPSSCAVVAFDHMEVVQVIQNVKNDIPLVAGKPAIARVFLKMIDPPKQPVPGVTAILRAFRSGSEVAKSPLKPFNSGPLTVQNAMARTELGHSLNFELPSEWVAEGKLELRADIQIPPCSSGDRPTQLSETTAVEFSTFLGPGRTSFRVAWLPYCYQPSGRSPLCPNDAEIVDYDYLMRAWYPIAPDALVWDRLSVPAPPPYTEPLEDGALGLLSRFVRAKKFVSFIRKSYLATEGRYYDQFVVILPSIPGSSLAGFSEKPGSVVFVQQQNPSPFAVKRDDPQNKIHYNANSVAHEIGHNYGRTHTNNKLCTAANSISDDKDLFTDWPYATADIQEIGMDVGSRTVIPNEYGDLMSYCSNLSVPDWVSPHTYTSLMGTRLDLRPPRLLTNTPSPEQPKQAALNAAAVPQVIISGWARSDASTGGLDPMYEVVSADDPPASKESGSHCLQFSSGSGPLSRFCFDLTFRDSEFSEPMDTDYFTVKVPLPSGATRLTLTTGGRELASLSASARPPSLTITSPSAGARWDGGSRTISWTGASDDGSPLSYAVLYSNDAGQSWLPMAMDLRNSQYTFDAAQISGGDKVSFRVIATSGFSSTTVDVGPINVVQSPALEASTSTLDFGNQSLASSTDRTLTISNKGSGPLQISSLAIDEAAFYVVSPQAPLTLAAGTEQTVIIRWWPGTAAQATGRLRIASNDPVRPSFDIALRGAGFQDPVPSASIGNGQADAANAIDFGQVPVSQSADAILRVSNSGSAALNVTAVSSSDPQFSSGLSMPFSIAAGQSKDVVLRFSPSQTGARSSTITISTNDPTRASLTAAARGTGVASTTAPQVKSGGAGNAATFQTPLTPGSLATIFGSSLASGTGTADRLPLPTSLAGITVTIAGIPAPLIYVSPGQINLQVPFEAPADGNALLVVTRDGVPGAAQAVSMALHAPGIFTYARTGTALDPVIVHADNRLVTPSSPAAANDVLIVYATGIGSFRNTPATGEPSPSQPLASAKLTPAVTVGGAPVQVLFAGLAPGFIGLVQINIKLPASLPAGNLLPLMVRFGDVAAPVVNLHVAGQAVPVPVIAVSPSNLDFGSVSVGQTKDLTLTVRNTGTATLTVNSVSSSNPSFARTSAAPFNVGAGSSQSVTVRFSPAAAGAQSGVLTITSNDPATPTVAVTLNGTGTGAVQAPAIDVLPATLDFGNVAVGQVKDLAFTVRNTGTATLTVTSITVANPTFAVFSTPVPLNVGANSFQFVLVRFAPFAAGTQTGTLTFASNDPIRSTTTVTAIGTGSGGGGGGGGGCVNPPANLVSWWTGDGTATDRSGGNNGTLQGGASFATGQVGQAFSFNGSTSYVQVGNPPALRLTGAITIDAWVNPRSVKNVTAGPPMAAIVTKWAQNFGDNPDSDSYGLWLKQNGNTVVLFSAIHQPGPREPAVEGGAIPLNTWSHVAMTFDPISGQFLLYVNGQQVASTTSVGPLYATNHNVQIGREDSYIIRPFDGLVDELEIHSRALSASEIQAIYNAGGAGKCK